MTTTEYDPAANPRNLAVVEDEYEEELELEQDRIQARIDRLNREIPLFRSEGWKGIRAEFDAQIASAVDALTGDRLNSMEAIAFVRGQLRTLQWLLAMPEAKKTERDMWQGYIKELKGATEE